MSFPFDWIQTDQREPADESLDDTDLSRTMLDQMRHPPVAIAAADTVAIFHVKAIHGEEKRSIVGRGEFNCQTPVGVCTSSCARLGCGRCRGYADGIPRARYTAPPSPRRAARCFHPSACRYSRWHPPS